MEQDDTASARSPNGGPRRKARLRRAAMAVFAALIATVAVTAAAGFLRAQSAIPKVPGFWRIDKYRPKPLVEEGTRLRFVTADDYPPFNYRNESGELTGFNVDVARAVCRELKLSCSFQSLPWAELVPTVERGRADVIVASLAMTRENRKRLDFTDRYYTTPARFAVRLESRLRELSPELLAARRVGVVKGTAHEAYLRAFFAQSEIVRFDSAAEAREALRTGRIEALFGDGISLLYWIVGTSSRGCCRFAGGPYTESRFFGEGVGMAVARGNRRLVDVLNHGLDRIRQAGTFEELFVRYFPLNLY